MQTNLIPFGCFRKGFIAHWFANDPYTLYNRLNAIRLAQFRKTRKHVKGFVTLDPPSDSDKLCILLQGFVWETCVSYMKVDHKIRSEAF